MLIAVSLTTFLYEQRHRRHDCCRDDEGLEDVQGDAGRQEAPRPRTREHHGGRHRWNEASQDRRIHLSPVRPQGDRVADEEEGEHDARLLFRG